MKVEEKLISECCGESSWMTIEHIEEGSWGRCSGCDQIAMFDDIETWEDLDDEEIAGLPSRQLVGPTGHHNTISEAYTEGERLEDILNEIGQDGKYFIPDYVNNFNMDGGPSIISWITDNIAVTSAKGAEVALAQGHFVINTAKEINNSAQAKITINPGSGNNLRQFQAIENVMAGVLKNTDQKVVVHCAMGMERSVTAVVWYLANTTNMNLKEALALVQSKRPIACNRLAYITS
jgi:rhodanese-related sulfurtransferase